MPNPSDITSVVWSAVNLPDGLVLSESTGIISGTPTTPGSYTTNVTVTTNWGTDTKAISIIVAIPDSWKPDIASGQVLYLTAGEEMEPYKITGTNIDLTPQELVPLTTPLLDVNDENYEYVSYLPFDDYPTLDLARKIQWENHGCELITVGEGEHNKRLSFANGGYMIGTGEFRLFDVGSVEMVTTLDCTNTSNSDVLNNGCFVCLYNDDYSNFIAFITGRDRNPDNGLFAFLLNGSGAQFIAFSAPDWTVNNPVVSYWLNGGYPANAAISASITAVPKSGNPAYTIMLQGSIGSDIFGVGDYRCQLDNGAGFTHMAINYNPFHPETRIAGSLGAFYLRKRVS